MLESFSNDLKQVGWGRLSMSAVRAHACSVAVCVGWNSWWRAPRAAFRYGGLAYALVLSAALLLVGLPIALLHLATGQLSQQDAVGVWRAVPFFKGIGYLRLLVTSFGSIYTNVYLALVVMEFFHMTSYPNLTWECTELMIPEDVYETTLSNSSVLCYDDSTLFPIVEQTENYVAIGFILAALWIVFPLLLYHPVKFMRRIFYLLGPVTLILIIVVVSCLGDRDDLLLIQKRSDWINFLDPDIWFAAFIQALWSAQIAGGFLISSGDTIYLNTDVQWTAIILIVVNISSSWLSIITWFAIGGDGDKDLSTMAVLFQVHILAEAKQLNTSWILVLFATLFLSGIISMLTLLYPVYDRLSRAGGPRWRALAALCSLCGGGAGLLLLAGGQPTFHLLEDIVTPLLISVATVVETSAFIFIYGWKILVEDIEFLTGKSLSKYWVMGWITAPGIIAPFSAWWVSMVVVQDTDWKEMPWDAATVICAAALALLTFVTFAAVAVAKQVQYDFIGKLKSSFRPSRHWGPRDPITHYYWLAQREQADRRALPRIMYHRRNLGQLFGTPGFLHSVPPQTLPPGELKRRANSDDWVYTVQRRKRLENFFDSAHTKQRRSKSLDWEQNSNAKTKNVSLSTKKLKQIYFIETDNEKNNNSVTKDVK